MGEEGGVLGQNWNAGRRLFLGGTIGFAAGASLTGTAAVARLTRTPAPIPAELAAGVSLDLARTRTAQLSAVAYEISLDLTQADTAAGALLMRFDRSPDAGDLVIDFRGPLLGEIRANGATVTGHEWRNGHLRLPAGSLATGMNQLEIDFGATIAAAGAAIIRFQDDSDRQTYLYTLLVPSNANLLFPCFDQPDLKARIRWRLTAPAGWSVLANGRLDARASAGNATRWSFAETAPISTYLAAFAAGPWASWPSAPVGERPVTLYARASRRGEVEAEALIGRTRAAASWLERWFGVPFPFDKLDSLLAPAFPFGGMEHVGAIFYAEDNFIFRERPTLTAALARDATIYHEVSHQWFGDLVTMRWFDDLWLKEGFSNYMAARIQDELQPSSEAWKTFYLQNKPAAYRTDSTRGTTPLWQALDNLDGAKSNYGPIAYNKAPSVIKQLAYLVGEDAFRRGLHLFLTRYAYRNATWRDLLSAVGESAGAPLDAFGRQYVLRAGMPRIDTQLEVTDGRIAAFSLTQRPVRALPGDPGGAWPMKVRVRLGYHDRPDVLLEVRFEGETAEVAGAVGRPAPDYVWANDGDQGYGLFMPDAVSADWMVDHVGEVSDGLLRAMLWGALWDLVRDRRLAPARFVELVLRELPKEADEQIAWSILRRAETALVRYVAEADRARLAPVWEQQLAVRAGEAALAYGLRKDSLDTLVRTARTPAARAILREYLAGARLFDGGAVKQPTRWRILQRLLALGEPDAPALCQQERASDVSSQAARDAFVTGAAAPEPAVKADYFRRYFDDAHLNEDWVTKSLGAFNTPEQTALTLPYVVPALDRLAWIRANRQIFFLSDWIWAFVLGQTRQEALEVVDRFLKGQADLPPDLRRKLLEARDELERTVGIRRAAGAQV